MLAIIGASGKLGSATLNALISNHLIPTDHIVCCTSSQPDSQTWRSLDRTGAHVRHATFDDRQSMEKAFAGCDKLFLVSSPRISLDFNNAPEGSGREKHHFSAIDAAVAAGVKHVYYTSLAFQNPSKAGVMRAHIRTEHYLSSKNTVPYTVIREGIYSESWPLYLGYFDPAKDERSEVIVAGDGPISWTSIEDLGLANALILAAPSSNYANKTLYLSVTQGAKSLSEIAQIVGREKGRKVSACVVSRDEHEHHYIEERKMAKPAVEWWSSTYDALHDQECLINDDTLERLLSSKGKSAKPVQETVAEMLNSTS